jgi:hypothetical protein
VIPTHVFGSEFAVETERLKIDVNMNGSEQWGRDETYVAMSNMCWTKGGARKPFHVMCVTVPTITGEGGS